MKCENCGEECWRDSADVGVGTIYGPWGCSCGWSESEEYNQLTGSKKTELGGIIDQFGIVTPMPAVEVVKLFAPTAEDNAAAEKFFEGFERVVIDSMADASELVSGLIASGKEFQVHGKNGQLFGRVHRRQIEEGTVVPVQSIVNVKVLTDGVEPYSGPALILPLAKKRKNGEEYQQLGYKPCHAEDKNKSAKATCVTERFVVGCGKRTLGHGDSDTCGQSWMGGQDTYLCEACKVRQQWAQSVGAATQQADPEPIKNGFLKEPCPDSIKLKDGEVYGGIMVIDGARYAVISKPSTYKAPDRAAQDDAIKKAQEFAFNNPQIYSDWAPVPVTEVESFWAQLAAEAKAKGVTIANGHELSAFLKEARQAPTAVGSQVNEDLKAAYEMGFRLGVSAHYDSIRPDVAIETQDYVDQRRSDLKELVSYDRSLD